MMVTFVVKVLDIFLTFRGSGQEQEGRLSAWPFPFVLATYATSVLPMMHPSWTYDKETVTTMSAKSTKEMIALVVLWSVEEGQK